MDFEIMPLQAVQNNLKSQREYSPKKQTTNKSFAALLGHHALPTKAVLQNYSNEKEQKNLRGQWPLKQSDIFALNKQVSKVNAVISALML
jgi:hypothetical protein